MLTLLRALRVQIPWRSMNPIGWHCPSLQAMATSRAPYRIKRMSSAQAWELHVFYSQEVPNLELIGFRTPKGSQKIPPLNSRFFWPKQHPTVLTWQIDCPAPSSALRGPPSPPVAPRPRRRRDRCSWWWKSGGQCIAPCDRKTPPVSDVLIYLLCIYCRVVLGDEKSTKGTYMILCGPIVQNKIYNKSLGNLKRCILLSILAFQKAPPLLLVYGHKAPCPVWWCPESTHPFLDPPRRSLHPVGESGCCGSAHGPGTSVDVDL